MSNPYDLDRGALDVASMAYIDTEGTQLQKMQAAIAAYQFGLDARQPWGRSGTKYAYPSLNDVRAFLHSFFEPEPDAC